MWEPRRLTTPWAFTACYRYSFFFSYCRHQQGYCCYCYHGYHISVMMLVFVFVCLFVLFCFFFTFLEWSETESTWHVSCCLAYCTSPKWYMMMSVKQSVEWELALETEVLRKSAPAPLCPPQSGKLVTNPLSYSAANSASVAPTSQVHESVTLLLPVVGN
jgi:hypothetical protein